LPGPLTPGDDDNGLSKSAVWEWTDWTYVMQSLLGTKVSGLVDETLNKNRQRAVSQREWQRS